MSALALCPSRLVLVVGHTVYANAGAEKFELKSKLYSVRISICLLKCIRFYYLLFSQVLLIIISFILWRSWESAAPCISPHSLSGAASGLHAYLLLITCLAIGLWVWRCLIQL